MTSVPNVPYSLVRDTRRESWIMTFARPPLFVVRSRREERPPPETTVARGPGQHALETSALVIGLATIASVLCGAASLYH